MILFPKQGSDKETLSQPSNLSQLSFTDMASGSAPRPDLTAELYASSVLPFPISIHFAQNLTNLAGISAVTASRSLLAPKPRSLICLRACWRGHPHSSQAP